jgi:hypothetical protein
MKSSRTSSSAGANGARSPLVSLLSALATDEGFLPTALPDVRLMHSRGSHPPSPVVYEPSIVIIAQGYKRARLGNSTYTYDSRNYLPGIMRHTRRCVKSAGHTPQQF